MKQPKDQQEQEDENNLYFGVKSNQPWYYLPRLSGKPKLPPNAQDIIDDLAKLNEFSPKQKNHVVSELRRKTIEIAEDVSTDGKSRLILSIMLYAAVVALGAPIALGFAAGMFIPHLIIASKEKQHSRGYQTILREATKLNNELLIKKQFHIKLQQPVNPLIKKQEVEKILEDLNLPLETREKIVNIMDTYKGDPSKLAETYQEGSYSSATENPEYVQANPPLKDLPSKSINNNVQ